MRQMERLTFVALTFACALFMTACDWESGNNNDFNESQRSASNNTNISGFYQGSLSGGRIVTSTVPVRILNLTISQSGTSVTVRDNIGNTYRGTVGEAFFDVDNREPEQDRVTEELTTTVPVSFSGTNQESGREVEFTGVVIFQDTEFVQFLPDGNGGFDEFAARQLTQVIKGTWNEIGGSVGQVDGVVD